MENEDLEKLYSPSAYSKRFDKRMVLEKHIDFIEKYSQIVKESIPCELGISYGTNLRDKFDIYGTDLNLECPILIHIHGGYYQEEAISHTNNGFISNIFYRHGIKTILLGYALSPQRTLAEILDYLKIGLKECIQYAKTEKTKAIFLSGHSAGAHAISVILSDLKCALLEEKERNLIKGAFLLCGLYDLVPITKMSANDLLKLTPEMAKQKFSPLFDDNNKCIDYRKIKMFIITAENDSPAFLRQSEEFYRKIKSVVHQAEYHLIPVVDHFDLLENLYNEDYALTQIILKAIKI